MSVSSGYALKHVWPRSTMPPLFFSLSLLNWHPLHLWFELCALCVSYDTEEMEYIFYENRFSLCVCVCAVQRNSIDVEVYIMYTSKPQESMCVDCCRRSFCIYEGRRRAFFLIMSNDVVCAYNKAILIAFCRRQLYRSVRFQTRLVRGRNKIWLANDG